MSFPGGSNNEESTCNVGDLASTSELGRSPGGGHGKLLQYSCLQNPHGQRSLAVYRPWGHKESDMTRWLSPAEHSFAFYKVTWFLPKCVMELLEWHNFSLVYFKYQLFVCFLWQLKPAHSKSSFKCSIPDWSVQRGSIYCFCPPEVTQ